MINFGSLLTMPGVQKYEKDAVIAREGDSSTGAMYIVLHGAAGVWENQGRPGERMTATLEPGGFFGEMALFGGKALPNTLVALSDLIAIAITRQTVDQLFAHQPELTFSLVEGICRQVDSLARENRSLLEELGRAPKGGGGSAASALFPPGHGAYTLTMDNNSDCLYAEELTCPLCGTAFQSMTVIATKLRRDSTDAAGRVRYSQLEPLHYEIVSCPACLFSTQYESFPTISKGFWTQVVQAVSPYKGEVQIKTGDMRDTFTVFAGYYLAILCAPICFDEHQTVTGALWQKLGRLYDDCGDAAMSLYCCQKALEEYHYAYEHYRLAPKREQQVCFILGELHLRLDRLDEARNYYFRVKADKTVTPLLRRQADSRLEEIKERKAGEKAAAPAT